MALKLHTLLTIDLDVSKTFLFQVYTTFVDQFSLEISDLFHFYRLATCSFPSEGERKALFVFLPVLLYIAIIKDIAAKSLSQLTMIMQSNELLYIWCYMM